MDFPLYFKNVISKWPKVFKEIDNVCFRVFGPYFIGKSPCTTCRLTFEFWSIIVRPYHCQSVNRQNHPSIYGKAELYHAINQGSICK